jgi:serine/threonine protein kinase/Tfp pilus assembly protein PilF
MDERRPIRVRFGAFELDLTSGELSSTPANGSTSRIVLAQQPFRLLLLLVEREGSMVSREEIQKRFWPNDTIVEFDHSINVAIGKLRKALGDSADKPQYVATVASRGYRLLVPVERIAAAEDSSGEPLPPMADGAGTPEPPTATVQTGQTVSHYRVLDLIGGGGMGVVYRAEDLKLGRRVAIKFLPSETATDEETLQRFEREAQTASALNHLNICTIYEFGEHEGQPFLVMELLQGETLRDRLAAAQAGKGLPLESLLDIALQVSSGLQAAHERRIIHRDIKPANIFLTDKGVCKILDFGLAKLLEMAERETETGEAPRIQAETTFDPSLSRVGLTMGTAGYMSPEQVRGEKLDARTDLFSFGLVLYEMATGMHAFSGETAAMVRDAIVHQQQAKVRDLNPTIPLDLEAIINAALEKDREQRCQSAAEMRAGLERLTDSGQSAVHQDIRSSSQEIARLKKRHKRAVIALMASACVIAAIALGWIWRASRSRQPAHALTEKDTIVLTDFSNSTGDAIFDDTLKTALTVSLRQSPLLNVLSDGQIARTLEEMTRPPGTKLTPEIARELCLRAGSKAYIDGAIGSLGSTYVLELKAVNCRSGDLLAAEQVTAASKEKVLDALGDAASRLRGELGESLATVEQFDVPLQEATTSSLEALKAYSIHEPERAIQLDPNFAMGHWRVGDVYLAHGEQRRANEYYTRAFQLRDHTSERERLSITAGYYRFVTGELDKAVQTYLEEFASYPRDPHDSLGGVYAELGQYDKAAEIGRQTMSLAPDSVNSYSDLANYALALERPDEARQIIHEEQARNLDDAISHDALYALAFLRADSGAIAEQQAWFASGPGFENVGLALESDTEAYAGHLRRARELTRQAVESAVRASSKENGALWQAIAAQREAAFGNTAEARQSAAAALQLAPGSQGAETEAALALAMAGDTGRAESLAQNLEKRYPLDTQTQSLWLPTIQAQLALGRNNPAAALTALEAASPIELGQIMVLTNTSCLYHTYARGEAYLTLGQGSAAAAEFQKILDHGGIVWNCWTGALAHLGVARAYALEAHTSTGAEADAARVRAQAAYRDFLALWKTADPGIPIYLRAKQEYAKLQ